MDATDVARLATQYIEGDILGCGIRAKKTCLQFCTFAYKMCWMVICSVVIGKIGSCGW